MRARAVLTTNGETVTGILSDETRGADVVLLVDNRILRPADLPAGRLVVQAERRSIGLVALVERAKRAGYDATLQVQEVPAPRRDRRW